MSEANAEPKTKNTNNERKRVTKGNGRLHFRGTPPACESKSCFDVAKVGIISETAKENFIKISNW